MGACLSAKKLEEPAEEAVVSKQDEVDAKQVRFAEKHSSREFVPESFENEDDEEEEDTEEALHDNYDDEENAAEWDGDAPEAYDYQHDQDRENQEDDDDDDDNDDDNNDTASTVAVGDPPRGSRKARIGTASGVAVRSELLRRASTNPALAELLSLEDRAQLDSMLTSQRRLSTLDYLSVYRRHSNVALMLQPTREDEHIYMFGTRRVQLTVHEGRLLVRVGGGWTTIENFIKKNTSGETRKTKKLRQRFKLARSPSEALRLDMERLKKQGKL